MKTKFSFTLFAVLMVGLCFSTSALAKKQTAGAKYYFDENGNYNGLDISFCNLPQEKYERIPGVEPGPYWREDTISCSALVYVQTGFNCAMTGHNDSLGFPNYSCTPVGFNAYSAEGTFTYLPAWMSLEDSCKIVICGMSGSEPYYQHVNSANHL